MKPEHWDRVMAIVGEAASLDATDRERFLLESCDPAFRTEVLALLANADQASGFLERPAVGAPARVEPGVGSRVGPYLLTGELGRGGMSIVYRGERTEHDLLRPAAIKVLSSCLPADGWADRLATEGRILGSLQHPNIATLYDAGVTPDGAAYLVMELVEGEPLMQYCEAGSIPLRKRLELFSTVCSAVQFAHQRLVVHRDLKPANILVTADGTPKLLDFGIARLLTTQDSGGTTTATLLRAMTPNYASPEQIRGDPVTVATDVYSLGVVLYELLTGSRPLQLSGRSWPEILALLEREQPAKPSSMRTGIPDELDAITMKALRPNPDERYTSVLELASDISNFLAGRPVKARPIGAFYRARKFVVRHRVAVPAAAAAILLIAGSALAFYQQRNKAERRFDQLRQLAGAVIFEFHDGISALPGTLEVRRKMVRRSLDYLDLLAVDAGSDAGFQIELAQGYLRLAEAQGKPTASNLGDFEGALESITKARKLAEAALAAAPSNVDAARLFGLTLLNTGEIQQRVKGEDPAPTFRRALDYWKSQASRFPEDPRILGGLASAYYFQNEYEKALPIYEQLLASRPNDPTWQRNVALLSRYLGYKHLAERDRSFQLFERAIEIDRRRVAAKPLDRLALLDLSFDLSMMGTWHDERKDSRSALPCFEEVLRLREDLVRKDPKDEQARDRLLYALVEIGRHEGALGFWTRARDHYARAVELGRELQRINSKPNSQFAGLIAKARAGLDLASLHSAAR